MRANGGFTMVELLVTMIIISIVIGITYSSFTTIVKDVKSETRSVESVMDVLSGVEMLRLDLTHMGFGLAEQGTENNQNRKQEPCGYPIRAISVDGNPPGCNPGGNDDRVTLDNKSQALIIRSTVNTTNVDTFGWTQVRCGEMANTVAPNTYGFIPSNPMVIINNDFKFLGQSDFANIAQFCTETDAILYAFPVELAPATACEVQPCNRINYKLGASQTLPACHPKTFNLNREIGTGIPQPVINCVANFQVRFRYDNNGDGLIDASEVIDDIANKNNAIRRVDVYLLLQDSNFDADITTAKYTAADFTVNEDFNNDGDTNDPGEEAVNLATSAPSCNTSNFPANLPMPAWTDIASFPSPACFPNFHNYRWRVVKISVQPKNGADVFGLVAPN